ncbi:L,D-transpeptidase family protein [Streptomyces xanthochromogenes]|uniref:Uncharacterized protein n=1 Tax=Streptomyces xanthochromogenes TaxID=67384 RepID=A0ABQ3ASF2_9ACTN|nr:hypothetical protein [Streptomyces xanthochromogenes]GGY64359.1 hypothetical protein GCM10010326_68850 [Streptomyces xanthochromogenes]
MSDRPPAHTLAGTDLSDRLHALAVHGAVPAPTAGAQVRVRAVRRRRARRVMLSTTVLASAAVVTLASGALCPSAPPPPPSSTAAPPRPVQDVLIDLDTHRLTVDGRSFRIGAPDPHCPIGERAVTVSAKYPVVNLVPNEIGVGRPGPRNWAVTFTDQDHQQRLLLFELTPSDLPSVGADHILGAVGVAPASGKQVYDAVRLGAQVRIKGGQRSEKPLAHSACIDRQPVKGGG